MDSGDWPEALAEAALRTRLLLEVEKSGVWWWKDLRCGPDFAEGLPPQPITQRGPSLAQVEEVFGGPMGFARYIGGQKCSLRRRGEKNHKFK